MRFDCIHCRKATTKPQSVKGAFLRMLTEILTSEDLVLEEYHTDNGYDESFDVVDISLSSTYRNQNYRIDIKCDDGIEKKQLYFLP